MKNRLIRVIQQIAGEEGAYWRKVEINNHDAAELLPMITATDRAWWWERVKPGYEFRDGEPWRMEAPSGRASEGIGGLLGFQIWGGNPLYRDTRWTPPRPPLKVGDVIETVEDLERLPNRSGLRTNGGNLALRTMGRYQVTGRVGPISESLFLETYTAPYTIVYLPEAGGSDD